MNDLDKAIKAKLPKVGTTPSFVNIKCPHCKFKWSPKRGKQVQWCPKCHLDITEAKPPRTTRAEDFTILDASRFTPGRMQKMVWFKFYKYVGVPRNLPPLTIGRHRQREVVLRLADKFFRSEMTGTEMADELGIKRQAFYQRIEAAFDLMVERGSFQLTQKGREKIAREKQGMTAASRKTRNRVKPSVSSAAGAV